MVARTAASMLGNEQIAAEIASGLAHAHGVLIFEDDCYADLTWSGQRPPAIFAMSERSGVIHVGSFSKSIAPALRVGYVVAPWEVMSRMLALKTDAGDVFVSTRERAGPKAVVYFGGNAEDVTLFDRARKRAISLYASPSTLAIRGATYNEDDLRTYDVIDYNMDAHALEKIKDAVASDRRIGLGITGLADALVPVKPGLAEQAIEDPAVDVAAAVLSHVEDQPLLVEHRRELAHELVHVVRAHRAQVQVSNLAVALLLLGLGFLVLRLRGDRRSHEGSADREHSGDDHRHELLHCSSPV